MMAMHERRAGRGPGQRSRVGGSFLRGHGSQHVLMAELLAYGCIVAVRATADYAAADGGAKPGTESAPKGATPVVLLVAGLVVYFLLALLSAGGGHLSRAAGLFGGLVVLALLINSSSELDAAAGWIQGTQANASPVTTPDSGETLT